MSASSRWSRVAGVVLSLLLAVAACGVPAEEEVHRVPDDDVPEELLRVPTTLPPTTTTTPPARFEVTLYFVDPDERLVAVERVLDAAPALDDLVGLLQAPPEEGGNEALRSALARDEEPVVRSVSLERGVARVDLLPAFRALPASDQVLGIAQIVYTVTARSGVGRAAFTLEGEPVDVPAGDGSLTTEPVAREDYANLLSS